VARVAEYLIPIFEEAIREGNYDIKDIEFADYNGDGVAKGFLANAGINVPEFNKEVLRQVEQRLI